MLTSDLRQAIRAMKQRGMGIRAVARALNVSRNTVRDILRDVETPASDPEESRVPALIEADPRLKLIVRLLFKECEGSALRVTERLQQEHHIEIGYSTLTRYLRDQGLRHRRRGQHVHPEIITGPGIEMQLDMSPIDVKLGVVVVRLYLGQLICGFSRHRYAEFFPRWRRFHVKVFLVRALRVLGGICLYISIDNDRVIVIWGSGKDGVIAGDMERFAVQLGFTFVPVAAGHKDRQGKIEAAHGFVQKNFLRGRKFRDLADLNAQLATWCRDLFHRRVRQQTFAPADRWEEELAHMESLPLHIPEPADVSTRRVDDRGRIWLHGSSYRVPDRFVLKWLPIRETGDEVIVFNGRDEVCRHRRIPECERKQSSLPGRREQKTKRAPSRKRSAEEIHLRSLGAEVSQYLDALQARPVRCSYARLRRLYRFACEYPLEVFVPTMTEALVRRAFDLNLVEDVLEERMGHRIRAESLSGDPELEQRPAYRRGQVTPHRLREDPEVAVSDPQEAKDDLIETRDSTDKENKS